MQKPEHVNPSNNLQYLQNPASLRDGSVNFIFAKHSPAFATFKTVKLSKLIVTVFVSI